MKAGVAAAPSQETSRAARAKTPPRAATTGEKSDAATTAGNNSLVTDADVPPDMLPTIENLVRGHREATGEPWKCTKFVSATRNDDATTDVKLIICCGDMCQRKTFFVPRSA